MNAIIAAGTLKRIGGFLFTKLTLGSSRKFLSKILNESFPLNLPLLMDKQAKGMNILLFSSLTARLNKQSLLISAFADGTKVCLTLFLDCFADILASLALSFHLLAVFMHSHATFPTGFDWIEYLVVVAKAS